MKAKLLIPLGIVVIAIIGGVYFLFSPKQTEQKAQITPTVSQDEVIPTIAPSDLGLTLTARSDKKAVKFAMNNADDIESVEYQISYTKKVNGEDVPEGLIGEAKAISATNKIGIDYRELGTCSSHVCRYDTVVSPITVILKITKKDGKVFQAQDTLTL